MLGNYRKVLGKDFINRSKEALEECKQYVFLPSGKIEHSTTQNSEDPTDKKSNHGDRVIADALAAKLVTKSERSSSPKRPEPRRGTLAYRKKKAREKQKQKEYY